MFPEREAPKVAEYSVKKTYGHLLSVVEDAFNKNKPLFSLAIYYPLAYYKGADRIHRSLLRGEAEAGGRSHPHPVLEAVRKLR